MINVGSILKCTDNSGALFIKCIKLYKLKRFSSIGDEILISVKSCNPKKKIKKGEIYKALIIRTKYSYKYKNFYYKFNENAAILLNRKNLPIGTRLFGISIFYIRLINRKVFLLLENII
jgi:large subunit ribosomal protein L14